MDKSHQKFRHLDKKTIEEGYLCFTQEMSDEEKEMAISFSQMRAQKLQTLCVIYNPSCGCPFEHLIVLDRFPMSEKIIHFCEYCQSGCLLEISNPIIFYLPLTEKDYTLEDLKNLTVFSGPQAK